MAKPKLPPVFPDFMLIGAPEAGAGLVKQALLEHKKIWFPPLDNILAFHSSFQLARLQVLQKLFKGKIPFKISDLPWLLKYFFQPTPSVKWYSRLLRTKEEGLMKGEMSDEYFTLPFDEVEQLHRLMPKCKIILLIRNPVERSYAAIREKFSGNKVTPFDDLTKRQLMTLMNSDWARTHSSYQRALDSWPVFFPRANIFIGFYDDLIIDPITFMEKVQAFLNIEEPIPDMVADMVPPQDQGFPEEYLKNLHPFYRTEMEGLANRLSSHAGAWFDRMPAAPVKAAPRRQKAPPPKPKSTRKPAA